MQPPAPVLPMTLRDVAHRIGGTLEGDASLPIHGVADLQGAGPTDLSFLANPKYAGQARATQAAAVLVGPDFNGALPCALIRVANPSAAFATIIAHFAPPPPPSPPPGIHPSASVSPEATIDPTAAIGPHAVVESGAVIGPRCAIGAGVYLGHGVRLGPDCVLHPHVCVREHCTLGTRVILHCGVVVGADGFGYEFQDGRHVKIPQVGTVRIDDDVEIGANTTVDRARFGVTWIREGCKIDNLVMIAHNVVIGPHAIIVGQSGIAGSSRLGACSTLAGQSAIVGHVNVGDRVTIAGWTAVTKDLTQPGVYRGGPARPIKEALKNEALVMRLPELYERVRRLEKPGPSRA